MATRSTIALEFADGTVEQIYCHWDGYLSAVGAELVSEYSDPFALRDLIDAGDTSTIGSPYSERGEVCPSRKYADFAEYVREGQREEYNYILRNIEGVATWFVEFYATEGWVTMAEAVNMKEECDE